MLLLKRLWTLTERSVTAFFEDGCTQRAAAISYYVLFSMFPLVIFSVGIVGIFLRDPELQSQIVDAIMEALPLNPEQGRDDVTAVLQRVADDRSSALGVVGLVTLAWSGSAMFGVVRSALNQVFDVETPRPIVLQKFLDIALVLAFAPFFLASLVATSALRVGRAFSEDIEILANLENTLGAGWWLASTLLPVVFSFIAFFFVYWLIPAKRTPARYVLPGALAAALLFEGVKIGFSIYLEEFARYDIIFGSLGAVVAFMFWVFLSANILLLCGEFVSELPAVMAGRYDKPGPGPKLTTKQKIWKFLRGLVLSPRPPGEEERPRQKDRPAEEAD